MLNKKPKLIFIDLDGTSLDYKRKLLSSKNIDAINSLSKKGIKTVVSTGRGINKKTISILEQIDSTDNFIAWNGAKVIYNGEEIFSATINKEILVQIKKLILKYNMSVIVNSNFRKLTYTNNYLLKFIVKLKKGNHNKLDEFNIDMPIFKLIIWSPKKKNINDFYNDIQNKFKTKLNIVEARNYNKFIEVTDISASKGKAELLFAQKYGVDTDLCVHIGDTMNDASAAQYLKNVIAMKNATKDFKKIASHVSPFSYRKGGLAKTLKHFIKNTK
ncbi:Cof-type HAD-IIB family hydrolase [Mycoplasma sp. ES3225-GEN-MYC]|uniref:HAD-IIB family hydrolase n=1 Tax=Mycoplasma miroungigenitalium TaxID=754515 RepID=UPI001C11DA82|nr:HAD family hydrolase [Mycoplasma miroungigenitalium]MBU4691777.1 Cof-type HAD-IIB family hydrolase [Mycoplasma miroungigenitalium]